MNKKNIVINEGLNDKEKFKFLMTAAGQMISTANVEKYDFYVEEGRRLYDECHEECLNQYWSETRKTDQFKFFVLSLMSILHASEDSPFNRNNKSEKNPIEDNNVIDFVKYKDKKENNKISNIYLIK